ncbi:MAG: hypothetical protein JO182_28100 [Acidobacteriaceae bacterium]|nr:hypothetical protein [Acidobacteriaceae bacterium]
MKIFFWIAMAAAALSAVPASAQIGQAEQTAILKAHNTERAATGSPAEAALTWSAGLAAYAQAWAQTLATTYDNLVHRDASTNSADYTVNNTVYPSQSLGENIFGSTAADDGTLGATAVTDWISEKANYNNGTGCAAGQTCGHYTQVVWRNTSVVGCGKATSKTGWTYVVCNYYTPGNYIGQTPY